MAFEIAAFDLLMEPRSVPLPSDYYLGSALRGGFGRYLRRTVCVFPGTECSDCSLHSKCPYVYLFETPADGQGAPFGLESAPHPFVIAPPGPGGATAGPLPVRLVLIGRAISYLPHVLWSVQSLCEGGLGAERRPYLLRSVIAHWPEGPQTVWSSEHPVLALSGFQTTRLDLDGTENAAIHRISLRLVTPLRIRHERRLCTRLTFPLLVTNILRRLYLLDQYHGDKTWCPDYRRLIAQSEKVRCVRSRLRWYDWTRYSSRQETKMQMGGLIGTITFTGELGPFLPYLRAAELIHVGRNTSFGLGRIVIEEIE